MVRVRVSKLLGLNFDGHGVISSSGVFWRK